MGRTLPRLGSQSLTRESLANFSSFLASFGPLFALLLEIKEKRWTQIAYYWRGGI